MRPPIRSKMPNTRPSVDFRIRQLRDRVQQAGQQRVQAAAAGLVEAPVVGPVAHPREFTQQHLHDRRRRAERGEELAPARVVECRVEQVLEFRRRGVGAVALRRREHRAPEVRAHALPMVVELARERGPVGHAHRERETRASIRLVGQFVRLLVVPFLQAVLDRDAGSGRRPAGRSTRRGRQQLLPGEQRQRLEQAPRLQPRIAATAQQLECLDDELDLADAAGTELDVLLQLAPLDFARDQILHAAQRLEHAEIEVSPVHERAQHVAVERRRSPPRRRTPAAP